MFVFYDVLFACGFFFVDVKPNLASGFDWVLVDGFFLMACLVGDEGCRLIGHVMMVWLGVVVRGSLSQGVWPSSMIG